MADRKARTWKTFLFFMFRRWISWTSQILCKLFRYKNFILPDSFVLSLSPCKMHFFFFSIAELSWTAWRSASAFANTFFRRRSFSSFKICIFLSFLTLTCVLRSMFWTLRFVSSFSVADFTPSSCLWFLDLIYAF